MSFQASCLFITIEYITIKVKLKPCCLFSTPSIINELRRDNLRDERKIFIAIEKKTVCCLLGNPGIFSPRKFLHDRSILEKIMVPPLLGSGSQFSGMARTFSFEFVLMRICTLKSFNLFRRLYYHACY